jgi:hypothetical protein
MMNSDSNHKIVVGVVLATAFSVGVSVFAIRTQRENEAARNAPAPAPAAVADQNATNATEPAPASPAPAQTPTDPAAIASAAPPTAPPAIAPTPGPGASTASNGVKGADRSERHAAKARSIAETADAHVASTANPYPAPAAPVADSQPASAPSGQDAAIGGTVGGAGATSVEPAAGDTQITADVKSEIAAAAPNSAVDVTTSNGVVALAGSVPSQDAVDQARQAAQRVAGVKHVDASALTVSNQ